VNTLENIRIASPCRARWDDMTGDDRVRTCAACAKPVFNLSEMTRAEADAVIAKHGGDMCAQLYHRADGTIRLADCTVATVGMRARTFVLASALAAGAAYAKLHRGDAPAEAANIATAVDETAPPPQVELTTHEEPPPPPIRTFEAVLVTPSYGKLEGVSMTGGAVSFNTYVVEAPLPRHASSPIDDK
jgi:hypothetical protein